MYQHRQHNHDAHDLPARHRSLDLWFYEQRGSRYYLRLTRLGLAVIVVPTVLSLIALIVIFFFYRINAPIENPDININVQPTPSYSTNRSLIKPAPPPPSPPQVRSRPNVNANIPLVISTPGRNTNER